MNKKRVLLPLYGIAFLLACGTAVNAAESASDDESGAGAGAGIKVTRSEVAAAGGSGSDEIPVINWSRQLDTRLLTRADVEVGNWFLHLGSLDKDGLQIITKCTLRKNTDGRFFMAFGFISLDDKSRMFKEVGGDDFALLDYMPIPPQGEAERGHRNSSQMAGGSPPGPFPDMFLGRLGRDITQVYDAPVQVRCRVEHLPQVAWDEDGPGGSLPTFVPQEGGGWDPSGPYLARDNRFQGRLKLATWCRAVEEDAERRRLAVRVATDALRAGDAARAAADEDDDGTGGVVERKCDEA